MQWFSFLFLGANRNFMQIPMINVLNFWLLAGGLLLGILAFLEVGRRIGLHRKQVDPEGAGAGLGAIDGAVFGLMGLLIAFTFSGAATRFDARRQLVGQEANDIGTAYLRIDLLPQAAQPALREDFRNYTEARHRHLSRPPRRPERSPRRVGPLRRAAGQDMERSRRRMQRGQFAGRDYAGVGVA